MYCICSVTGYDLLGSFTTQYSKCTYVCNIQNIFRPFGKKFSCVVLMINFRMETIVKYWSCCFIHHGYMYYFGDSPRERPYLLNFLIDAQSRADIHVTLTESFDLAIWCLWGGNVMDKILSVADYWVSGNLENYISLWSRIIVYK